MDNGELVPSWCASLQTEIEQAVSSNMAGNLGTNPPDANDTGVECVIDSTQKIVSTERFSVKLRVKPFGYAKYIDVYLGFKTVTT